MSLLKIIQQYDAEREAYIRELEDKVSELQAQIAESTKLLMQGEALRERTMLAAIVAGAYDNPFRGNGG